MIKDPSESEQSDLAHIKLHYKHTPIFFFSLDPNTGKTAETSNSLCKQCICKIAQSSNIKQRINQNCLMLPNKLSTQKVVALGVLMKAIYSNIKFDPDLLFDKNVIISAFC